MTEALSPGINLNLSAQVEALLFVASGPVSAAQLAEALEVTVEAVEQAVAGLDALLQEATNPRGLRIQRHRGRYQLTTAPETANSIERFLGMEATSRLSRAGLETLAIIAYQQPVTRPQVDSVRGVNSDGVIKNLLSKGLIAELGRSEAVGRPILYGTTPEFLQYFGLDSLETLPALNLAEATGGNGSVSGNGTGD